MAVEVPVLPREKVRSIQDVTPEEQHDSDGSSDGEDADDVDRDADRPSMRIVTITLALPKKVGGGSTGGGGGHGGAAAAGTPSSPTSSTASTVCSKSTTPGGGGLGATPKTAATDEYGVPLDQALRRRLNLDDV